MQDDDEKKRTRQWAQRSESRSRLEAMVAVARADDRVVVAPDDLDADAYLLNCTNGTVDLRTGQLLAPDQRHLITKSTGVDYLPGSVSDDFEAFLEKVQPEKDMRGYLARLFGHTLVGAVYEHVLPVNYGTGANGKGSFTTLVQGALGEYAATVPASLLLASDRQEHPTGLADLQGKRLVIASETSQTKRLDEATVKTLTGGDKIKARFLYQDYFEFTPSHSVMLVTNYKPVVRGTDHGIWRRLRLIPWSVEIAPQEIDLRLNDKLRDAWPAVLAWIVAGCLEWQTDGLAEPAEVTAATKEYRTAQDSFGRFIDDLCQLAAGLAVTSKRLREVYLAWCADEGEEALSPNDLADQLRAKGLHPTKLSGQRGWKGLAPLNSGNAENGQRWTP
jgi:putative DNA primase/helicase